MSKSQTKILVIDDDIEICETLAEFFTERGWAAITLTSGDAAVQKYQESSPILVFLDVLMPGLDGIAVLKAIRRENPEAKVVMMSGQESEQVARRAIELGAYDYLSKPLDPVQIELLVNSAFSSN